MRIIVSHVYSNHNKGDAALLSVLLGDIKRVFDNPQITILTMDSAKENDVFEGVKVKSSFMHYASDRSKNLILRTTSAFFIASSTLLWAVVYRVSKRDLPLPKHLREIAHLYRDADIIIPVGGGYVRSKVGITETSVLFFIIHPFLLASIIQKQTICYTQSIGPFGNLLQEIIAKFGIKRVTGVIAREEISLNLLKKWKIKNIFLSVDSGFAFKSNVKKDLRLEFNLPATEMLVGITVRNWFTPRKQASYEKIMARLADYIVEHHHATVIFIPQVTVDSRMDDDRESSKRVHGYMKEKDKAIVLNDYYHHETIKAMYGSLNYLVGVRFHSVIFALTSIVPSIAIGYEHKTRGIMTDLGLEKWVIEIKKLEVSELILLFDNLVENRSEYIDYLQKTLPSYIERAEKAILFVKKIYEQELANKLKVPII